MKQIVTLMLTSIQLIIISCNGQETTKPLKVADVTFNSIFGMTRTEPKSTYCLLGSGFFRTPRSNNSDSLITAWIKSHPNAIIIPVTSFGPVETNDPESKMIYCWIMDGDEILNIYLIRNGCFPGGTMIRPKTWREMGKAEKESYENLDDKPNVKVFIEEKKYANFIDQIKSAETYARKNKLGIWLETEE